MHHVLNALFVVGIAVCFAFLYTIRPGAEGRRPTKRQLAGLLVIGAVIGVVFLATSSLYAPPPVAA
ncbi:hypothetical protein GCM10010885_11530 [Alicyclobacillus cellulosilyticus]|uniref:Uncharacterized protein n=1 Tax=Alicyclobacillus cellulosilyticus TaxID=1003997 RepID=A0A917NIW5_9BACL|nr:hypothetical protein [Alicyclobacillus cellulosilyticus]GGJ03987.1 hypothetical protein GCM10010885_11530 [Alicyclobacillus cellulosilyticus]